MKSRTLLLLFLSRVCTAQIDKDVYKNREADRILMMTHHVKSKMIIVVKTDTAGQTTKPAITTDYFDLSGNLLASMDGKRPVDSSYYNTGNRKTRWLMFASESSILSDYDAENRLIKNTVKNFDGTIQEERDYEYDSLGNNTRIVVRRGNAITNELMRYDGQGNLLELYGYDEGARIVRAYDENSNEIRQDRYDKSGALNDISYSTYDKDNRKIRYIQVNAANDTIARFRFEYNSKGKMTRKISSVPSHYNGVDSSYNSDIIYEYNGEDLPVQQTETVSDRNRYGDKKIKTVTRYTYEKYL